MRLEPSSWTTPPMALDLTDANLPRHCECGAFLPHANKWEVEDTCKGLVAFTRCAKCVALVSRVVARR